MMSVQFDSDKIKAAGRDLSDALAALSWPRFWLIALLTVCLFGALGDIPGLGALEHLGVPVVISCILIKILAKSRANAASDALDARMAAHDAKSEARGWKSRLDAHFLFNAMAAIEHLIERDPAAALPAQRALAAYLRSGLSEPETSSAKAQAAACEAYLLIQKIRMGERLQSRCQWLCDAPMPGRVAIAALEAAVSGCVEPSIQGGAIEIICRSEGPLMVWEMSYPELCPLGADFEPLRQEWLAKAPGGAFEASSSAGRASLRLIWAPASPSSPRADLSKPAP